MNKLNVLMVAGEPSGDLHGANLIIELTKHKNICLFGTGGVKLARLGQKQLATVQDMAVIGFDGAVKKIPYLLKLANELENTIEKEKIDIVILIDYAGFNLRFAKRVNERFPKLPIVDFIAPQVWIWQYNRVKKLKKYFDKVLCILPFEENILKSEGIDAVYVGNPVTDNIKVKSLDKNDFYSKYNLDINKKLIGLVPGSRIREIKMLLPVFLEAAGKTENVQFVLAQADSVSDDLINEYIDKYKVSIPVVKGETIDVMKYSDLLWICSGTATLEAGILGTPMIIMYQSQWYNFLLLMTMTSLRMVGMPNVIADKLGLSEKNKPLMPELLWIYCTSKNLVNTTADMIDCLDEYRNKLAFLHDVFLNKHAMVEASKEILKLLKKD